MAGSGSFRVQSLDAISDLCALLVEVADGETTKELEGYLKDADDPARCAVFMWFQEMVRGLPPFFTPGVSHNWESSERRVKFERDEWERRKAARRELLEWCSAHDGLAPEVCVQEAISMWQDRLPGKGFFGHGVGLVIDAVEPLIRMGTAALPEIEKRKGADPAVRPAWELVRATITGSADEALLRELLAGDQERQAQACVIITASGSKGWLDDLKRIVLESREGGAAQQLAIDALVKCHEQDAVPFLKQLSPVDIRYREWVDGSLADLELAAARARQRAAAGRQE